MLKTADIDTTNVKKKAWIVQYIPFVGYNTATAFYPSVYLPSAIYDDVMSTMPNPYNIALVIHEQEHVRRIEIHGKWLFYLKYVFSKKFRYNEELAAIKPQFAYLKSKDLPVDIERKAALLSGWLYLWPVRYRCALSDVKRIWNGA